MSGGQLKTPNEGKREKQVTFILIQLMVHMGIMSAV
jgi:hypothetical protein